MDDVYKRLATKLDELPHGFPPADSGVELKILRKVFQPEEAEMALKLRPIPETVEAIAQRLAKPVEEMQTILDMMITKGQIGSTVMGGQHLYMLMPFVVGIFEFQLNRLDKELAELVEEYAPALVGTLGAHKPALTRVVPINAQVNAQQEVRQYDDIKLLLEKAKSFQVMDCICRKEQALQGKPCSHTSEVCLGFSNSEGAFDKLPRGRTISKEEALAVMTKAEEEGLVHLTYNVQDANMFVCNCCSCCCGVLRALTLLKAPYMVARSNYCATIDQDACAACGICADERCPVKAIVEDDGAYQVSAERCIGCGVCTPTCSTGAITLIARDPSEQDVPPANIPEWYFKRAASRGISIKID